MCVRASISQGETARYKEITVIDPNLLVSSLEEAALD
jgi:hypothetical protein